MSLKLITIDDEKYVRDFLIEEVNKNFQNVIDVCGQAASIKDGLELIKRIKPDIVLLDIELEDGVSFDILKRLEKIDFEIIFVTGFDNKAIQAIKLGALDYLLKPIDEEELEKALNKAVSNRQAPIKNSSDIMTDVASQFYKSEKKEHIVLKTSDTVHLVKLNRLMYCKSEGNYTTFYLDGQSSILISRPLKYAVELLPELNFVRCQQSYIINTKYVTRFLKSGTIILQDKIEIPVSGRNKESILKLVMSKMK
ncbi:LytR/AlgR family response regulator transcription factor [Nonlabens sp. Asnod2-A12]|uniref:LytR/AlgR family response regulator transcription factor n=1 Tax=Nonlabens sp. Asnod2-A12 TaxID=3160578 RepID=UPI003864A7D3